MTEQEIRDMAASWMEVANQMKLAGRMCPRCVVSNHRLDCQDTLIDCLRAEVRKLNRELDLLLEGVE